MSWWNLSAASDWLESLNMLTSIQELHLINTSIPPIDLNSLSQPKFTVLEKIDLSDNNLNSTFPYWLTTKQTVSYISLGRCGLHGSIPEAVGNLTALTELLLYQNSLEGAIPVSIGRLCNLQVLDLSNNNLVGDIDNLGKATDRCLNQLYLMYLRNNNLSGSIPGWLGSLKELFSVDLSNNSLSGPVPSNIGQLKRLYKLDISYNFLQGVLSEEHLANLSELSTLVLSSNSLKISVGTNWLPPFQLFELSLRSCPLELQLPQWLRTQTKLHTLDLQNTGTIGPLPDWLWASLTSLVRLDLSSNLLTGTLPASLVHMKSLDYLKLDSNKLEGQVPDMPSIRLLDLSRNSFSGPLPHSLGGNDSRFVFLSENSLNGSIPLYFCEMELLSAIDLSNNRLSGEIPNCWKHDTRLFMLDFSNNHLEGEIPSTIGSLNSLGSLNLNRNKLSGVLPFSLSSCSRLVLLDLGENQLEGPIPAWIGDNLQLLIILRLRSNQFSGNIPAELSQLQGLRVLDLANNNLSGALPRSIGNFTKMASHQSKYSTSSFMTVTNGGYIVSINVSLYITMKGEERIYSRILYLMKSIDLSDNDLSGEIPAEIGALVELKNLNLSRNRLSGPIPETVGHMGSLESLDLSWNQLSGAIPQTMASLHLLSHLNMSYNSLSGNVPPGSQLQTLGDEDPYIYAGNSYLCSPLVPDSCSELNGNPVDHDEHKDGHDILLYVFSGLGFGIGFVAVWWLLIFSKAVSKGYFQSVDSMCEKICDRMIILKIKMNMKLMGANQNPGG
ncbi:LRR receptor-like serine/threonine-protein kinase GSO1 [Panicum miliaceum]|uniref:LRR receptor-like serine/threonine-protein kinase GSO1 n=1 Tax=Panicum miliaceum TaxID=4540 RepID=A0A3L6S0F1_PANMI|nr:LRR receptor-like serine/threonine-protein kinase GSO1 [Panicum miliaceum]